MNYQDRYRHFLPGDFYLHWAGRVAQMQTQEMREKATLSIELDNALA
jgi:hypothetical protein